MADDQAVRTGTRYDALRMLGVAPFEQHGRQLSRYLAADAHPELQMGAVSGLSDIDDPQAAKALVAAFDDLTDDNRSLAIAALLRTKPRMAALVDALESGRIEIDKVSAQDQAKLRQIDDATLHKRLETMLGND